MSDDGPDWGYGEQRAVDEARSEEELREEFNDLEEADFFTREHPDGPHDQLDDPHNQPLQS